MSQNQDLSWELKRNAILDLMVNAIVFIKILEPLCNQEFIKLRASHAAPIGEWVAVFSFLILILIWVIRIRVRWMFYFKRNIELNLVEKISAVEPILSSIFLMAYLNLFMIISMSHWLPVSLRFVKVISVLIAISFTIVVALVEYTNARTLKTGT